jgi:hypothetical protein
MSGQHLQQVSFWKEVSDRMDGIRGPQQCRDKWQVLLYLLWFSFVAYDLHRALLQRKASLQAGAGSKTEITIVPCSGC